MYNMYIPIVLLFWYCHVFMRYHRAIYKQPYLVHLVCYRLIEIEWPLKAQSLE